jgi:hypothetical protein
MGDRHEPDFLATETIDLNSLFTRDVATSGTFDLRGLEATSLGKLLQTIPIPALLVDGACAIAFANEASENIAAHSAPHKPGSFSLLFADAVAASDAEALIKRVFATRKPEVMEAPLKKGRNRLWGRMHFRPLRVGKRRSVLVLVEDLTPESKRAAAAQKHLDKLRRSQDLLEKRLARNVANLRLANSLLKQETADRKRAEDALKKADEQLKRQAELLAGEQNKADVRAGKKTTSRSDTQRTKSAGNSHTASDPAVGAFKDFKSFVKLVRSAAHMAREDLEKEHTSRVRKHLEKLLKHCAIADEKVVAHEARNAGVPDIGS